jgi:hypothetical protein
MALSASRLPPLSAARESIPKESKREQSTSKNGADEIHKMPGAVRLTPSHHRQQLKRLGNMRKHDNDQTD